MIGRDDLPVVRGRAAARSHPHADHSQKLGSTPASGVAGRASRPAVLAHRLAVTRRTFPRVQCFPRGRAPHFNFGFQVKTSPQPSTICNSQPLPVPKFQIRLHKNDDDKSGKQVRIGSTSKVTVQRTLIENSNNIMKRLFLVALSLVAPLTVMGDTVFSDTFGSGSTINGTPTAPTASTAAYQNWSQGAVPAGYTIASGDLHFAARNTASVFAELQAQFTSTPITLATIGDSVDLTIVFTDTANILNSADNTSAQLTVGLYNSGGVLPLTGSRLDSGSAATGGAAGYLGYIGRMYMNGNSSILTRPAQSGGATSTDQELLFNNAGTGAFNSPTATAVPGNAFTPGVTTSLANGSTYTLNYQITLSAASTLTISNALYSGSSVAGTPLFTDIATASGATLLTTNFDALAFGWRHTGPGEASSVDISSITVNDLIQAVPEPTVFALSAFGGLGLLVMRRWQRRT